MSYYISAANFSVIWGFDKKTVAVLQEMQSSLDVAASQLSAENSNTAAAEKVSMHTRAIVLSFLFLTIFSSFNTFFSRWFFLISLTSIFAYLAGLYYQSSSRLYLFAHSQRSQWCCQWAGLGWNWWTCLPGKHWCHRKTIDINFFSCFLF